MGIGHKSWWDMHYRMFRRVYCTFERHLNFFFFFAMGQNVSHCQELEQFFLNYKTTTQIQMRTTSLSSRFCPLTLMREQKPDFSACRSSNGLEFFIFLFLLCRAIAVSKPALDLRGAARAASLMQGENHKKEKFTLTQQCRWNKKHWQGKKCIFQVIHC